MMSEGKWNGNFAKDWESNVESNVWRKTNGEKEDRGPNVNIGIERNSGLDGKGEWSEMKRACVEEGWWACFEKSVSVEVKGKRKQGWAKKKWKTQMEKESQSVGLEKANALNRARWRVGVGEITIRVV